MTLDEAINRLRSYEIINSIQEKEQIAEWLEELKSYKSDSITRETFEKMKRKAYEKGCRQGYNKAIDDFVEKLCDVLSDNSTNVYFDGVFCDILTLDNVTGLIFMIEEQLKEGEKKMTNGVKITDDNLFKEMKEYCEKNGYKLKEFVEICIKNELKRRKKYD